MRLALIALVVGCSTVDADPLPGEDSGSRHDVLQGFESGLSEHTGCTDTWLQVWDPTVDVGLEIYVAGLAAEAGTGQATRVVDLTDPGDDWLRVVSATPIADNYCTDGLVERTVHETWEPTAGTLTVAIDASDTGADATASIGLSGVALAWDGQHIDVAESAFADIRVIANWGG